MAPLANRCKYKRTCKPVPVGIKKGVQVGVETAGQRGMHFISVCARITCVLCLSVSACEWVHVHVHSESRSPPVCAHEHVRVSVKRCKCRSRFSNKDLGLQRKRMRFKNLECSRY